MIPPAEMALMALTIMLWILWSDSVRPRRASQIMYTMRVALYLVVAAVLILNLVRYPEMFSASARVVCFLTVAVGLLGAAFFARKLMRRN
jgi:hypothetical protein